MMVNDRMVKVVCLYTGPRRSRNCNPTTQAEVLRVHDVQYEAELEYHGYDVVFVMNGGQPTPAYLKDWIFAYTRENEGGSFGAFSDAFFKMSFMYDWFFFCEDDVLVTDPGVFREAVDYMKVNPGVGFVALAPMAKSPVLHSGGGFGVGRMAALEAVAALHGGRLPFAKNGSYGAMEVAEWQFTGSFKDAGWDLVNLPGVSPFAENWKDHESQRENGLGEREGRHVYRVGL